jgi:hypothetical protein
MRIGVAVAVVGAIAAFAAGAWSAPSASPVTKLQRDVKVLKGQVKTLRTDVKKLKKQASDNEQLAVAVALWSICSAVVTADSLQGTWTENDQLSSATQAGKTYFGPQSPVSDLIAGQSVCQALGVPRGLALPPTTASFTALIALFQQGALRAQTAGFRQLVR